MTIIRDAEIATRIYETTDIKLICQKHKNLIYSTKTFQHLEDVSGKEFFKKITEGEGFFFAEEGKRKKLFSYAHLKDSGKFEGFEWILMVGHDVQEILQPAFQLRNRMTAAFFILITIGIIITFFMSRSITKPIAELTKSTEIIGKGDLAHRVEIKTKDETALLANAFNVMMSDLEKVTASRDDLNKEIVERKAMEKVVEQRKRDLQERVKELNCLYEISSLSQESQEPQISIEKTLQRVVELIPPSWQYPGNYLRTSIVGSRGISIEEFQ